MSKETNNELSEILSAVSHELRSPIAAINGYLRAISDGVVPAGEEQKYIDIAISESDRAIRLLENIMTLAKISSGSAEPHFEKFDINELIRLAVIEKATAIEQKKIDVITDFASKHIFVSADREMILHVLLNLIDNSTKYGKENGFIRLSTCIVSDKVKISCTDNGQGIDQESMPHIFEKFYRAKKSTSFAHGYGLGLPLVKEILLLHSSDLEINSTLNKGTEIQFCLKNSG